MPPIAAQHPMRRFMGPVVDANSNAAGMNIPLVLRLGDPLKVADSVVGSHGVFVVHLVRVRRRRTVERYGDKSVDRYKSLTVAIA